MQQGCTRAVGRCPVCRAAPPAPTGSEEELASADALRRVRELSDLVRAHTLAGRELIDERNAAIRHAIDLYGCSHRQVARASALALGRIHGILAND